MNLNTAMCCVNDERREPEPNLRPNCCAIHPAPISHAITWADRHRRATVSHASQRHAKNSVPIKPTRIAIYRSHQNRNIHGSNNPHENLPPPRLSLWLVAHIVETPNDPRAEPSRTCGSRQPASSRRTQVSVRRRLRR